MQNHPVAPEYDTPLVVGVTGHRDLVQGEIDELRALISEFYADLRAKFPNTRLQVMTALAEGADRLAAQVAIDAGIEVCAVLPLAMSNYRKDFVSAESRAEFDKLCALAQVLELPAKHATPEAIAVPGADRNLCYAHAGMFISAHCHILLALWDGVASENIGGTSQIIYFQHYDRLPGIAETVPRTSLFLTDDESDLVYVITCSRQSHASEKAGERPLQAFWFTTDPDCPRSPDIPARYDRVFERADSYNRDIEHYIARHGPPAATEPRPPATRLRDAATRVLHFFDIADAVANGFQQRIERTFYSTYALAFLTGFAFILYSEVSSSDPLIFAFLGFLIAGIIIAGLARRREWHRKYLDYRVLAEGLRVQYYRAVAGVKDEGYTKFAYDNFLRQRDMELGWIRNVMRVAGAVSDIHPGSIDKDGLGFAICNWIGSQDRPGQLEYYQKKARERALMNRVISSITQWCLWGGIVVALILASPWKDMGQSAEDYLIVMMGMLPLIAGIAEVYTQRTADRELTKQYQFMAHVFANARRRLAEAANDEERSEVLQGLGDAALSEHAEWILVRRERQPEPGGI
jgi:hypothetical protein